MPHPWRTKTLRLQMAWLKCGQHKCSVYPNSILKRNYPAPYSTVPIIHTIFRNWNKSVLHRRIRETADNKKNVRNKNHKERLIQDFSQIFFTLPRNCKSNPITRLGSPRGLQEVEAPRFQDNRHMKVVSWSLRNGCLYRPPPSPQGNIPGTHFYYRLSQPQGHSASGRIMSTKNSNDTIGNRTRDLPPCSALPQPTAPPRAPSTKL